MSFEKLPITVLIMTQNEELNISYTLDSVVPFFEQVVVTDSYSIDKTPNICRGYKGVEFYENGFKGWAEQRNWMLNNVHVRSPIVFFLDADEVLSFQFILELKEKLRHDFDAIQMKFDMYFLGEHIKYSYGHPVVKRIFKYGEITFQGEGAREYSNFHQNVLSMQHSVRHEDHRGISFWIDKHNRNSDREADLYRTTSIDEIKTNSRDSSIAPGKKFKLFIRHKIWRHLPLMFRPFIYFIYRYIFCLGFLDGRVGFIFCFLHAFWYQSLIDIKIIEKKHMTSKFFRK